MATGSAPGTPRIYDSATCGRATHCTCVIGKALMVGGALRRPELHQGRGGIGSDCRRPGGGR